jgi:hypothetical protein
MARSPGIDSMRAPGSGLSQVNLARMRIIEAPTDWNPVSDEL